MRSKPNLVSLCGIADDATEADLSGRGMDADDAIILASELPDEGAMTKLDISFNDIRAEGGKALAAGLKGNQVIQELNISDNELTKNSNCDADTSGVIAIADAIPGMGALASLDLFRNNICNGGVASITTALKMHAIKAIEHQRPCISIRLGDPDKELFLTWTKDLKAVMVATHNLQKPLALKCGTEISGNLLKEVAKCL
jgi:hypothetical protein